MSSKSQRASARPAPARSRLKKAWKSARRWWTPTTKTRAPVSQVHGADEAAPRVLTRYSPDMNPIDGVWSKFKAHLLRVAARTAKRLDAALVVIPPPTPWAASTHAGYLP